MAALTVQNIVLGTSLTPSFDATAAGGDTFVNNGSTFLYVRNSTGGSIDVTVDSQVNCNQGYDHDDVTSVPDGSEEMIGPFAQNRFNDSDGAASVSYSATGATIAVISLGA